MAEIYRKPRIMAKATITILRTVPIGSEQYNDFWKVSSHMSCCEQSQQGTSSRTNGVRWHSYTRNCRARVRYRRRVTMWNAYFDFLIRYHGLLHQIPILYIVDHETLSSGTPIPAGEKSLTSSLPLGSDKMTRDFLCQLSATVISDLKFGVLVGVIGFHSSI